MSTTTETASYADEFFKQNSEWRVVAEFVLLPPEAHEIQELYADADGEVLENCLQIVQQFEGGSIVITRGALYLKARRSGESPVFAAMLAMQKIPGAMTDDVWWGGRKHFSEVYGDDYAKLIKDKLAKQGVHMGAHDEYLPELARFRGDPEAVINRAQGRGYIKRLCEQRGWECNGKGMNVKHREPESDPLEARNCVPLAEDLVRDNARRMIKKDPALARMNKRELREKVIAEHGSPTQ